MLRHASATAETAVVKKFSRLLIANRGEIALRVMRTARRMGIESVAVFSEADRHSLHAKQGDLAFCIGEAAATHSYLNMDRIIDTAIRSGAQAIHPGYGFLSENAPFAEKCTSAGLVFIGPSSKAITDMGTKSVAKQIMEDAGVPVVQGFHGEDQSDANLKEHAKRIGYPVMLKAVYGGGGKGMRIAMTEAQFDESLAAARGEARKSFGRDEMLVEKFVARPRHVEVQVFGDHHGHYVHLWERDCSVQRRHQKIIEEAPAPNIDMATRLRLGESAVRAAAAVKYAGAGTVEFIMDAEKNFYFMEMNTRLQVEHPVSEAITGNVTLKERYLVEWQLRVAQGEKLPLSQSEIPLRGHAFECRVYAEDTDKGAFMPTAGKLDYVEFPSDARVDTGIVSGDEVSVHYDPMIAKVIVWGESREEACHRLDSALSRTRIAGVPTNIAFVRRILAHPEFSKGNVYTEFIEDHSKELFSEEISGAIAREEGVEAALAVLLSSRKQSPTSPFDHLSAFRVNHAARKTIQLGSCEAEVTQLGDNKWEMAIGDKKVEAVARDIFINNGNILFRVEAEGRAWSVKAVHTGNQVLVFGVGEQTIQLPEGTASLEGGAAAGDENSRDAFAPMPGVVDRLLVKEGDSVKAGQAVVVVVAMKMEYVVRAAADSVVSALLCQPGQNVAKNTVLVKMQ